MKKKVIIFGCGKVSENAFEFFKKENVWCYCDNNSQLIGTKVNEKNVISYSELLKCRKDFIIVISMNENNTEQVIAQLERDGVYDYVVFSQLKDELMQNYSLEKCLELLSEMSVRMQIHSNYYKRKLEKAQELNRYLIRHINISDLKPAIGYLSKQQSELVDFVWNFLGEIEELAIKPFLMAGNLLGQIRNKHFIPWDDDMDFGLIRTEYNILLEFCKKNYHVCICEDRNSNVPEWVDSCTKTFSGEYILFIYENQIQISKGTSALDRKAIDFFAFDYFKEDISFVEYKKYIEKLEVYLNDSNYTVKEKYDYVIKELKESQYVTYNSNLVYFGIDNMETFKRKFNNDWIKKEVIFPLKKGVFEGKEFWIPNQPVELIKKEYLNFDSFPEDFGIATHSYWTTFMQKNYVNVEFYLVDSFEIYHFLPIYHKLRERGVRAIFVAENPKKNTSGKWFDYEEAIRILDELKVEYTEECNPNANFAVTTQDAYLLDKYETAVKINMSYGYGLIKNSYAFSKRTVAGFDLRFVHGEFQKRKLMEYMEEKKIYIMGFPKHYNHEFNTKEYVKKILNIHTDKKILVYFPTYDEDCSVLAFGDEIKKLRKDFYIITKLHHVLGRDTEKRLEREKIAEFSDIILDGNFSFEDAAMVADIALCDAKSGASMEVPYINSCVKMVLLSVRNDIREEYFQEINELSYVINKPDELRPAIIHINDKFAKRENIIEECLGKRDFDYLSSVTDIFF